MSEDQKRKNSKNSVGPLDHFLGVGETNPEMSRDGSKTSSARKSKRVVHLLLDNGVRWPHIAVIAFNLIMSIPVLLLILVWLGNAVMAELKSDEQQSATITDEALARKNVTVHGRSNSNYTRDEGDSIAVDRKGPDYGFPGKLYCSSFLSWSLFLESTAQIIYTIGSGLLLIGALKMRKILCYSYVFCGILTLLICALARSTQFIVCDEKEYMTATNAAKGKPPGPVRPYLPPLFKLTFIWLVCQLFWYWLMLALVVAILNWIHKEELDGMGDTLEESSKSDDEESKPSTPPPDPPTISAKVEEEQKSEKF